ncbi:M56 family metallopeptidase [Gelidibacter sp. F2691]|nr:M56 family metallopeptidase [Gelidibacter sp. F2691]
MLHYILQTVAFQMFFLIIYDLFLKKETFFNWNRAYLLGTAILSVLLPFLKFESFRAIVPEPAVVRLPEVIIGEVSSNFNDGALMMPAVEISDQAMSFSWTYVWGLGILLAAILLIFKIVKISRLYYKNPQRWEGDALIVYLLHSSAAFSFFHYIFLGTEIESDKKEHIVQHELVHVREKHSIDLLFFETLRIVFWFNPLVYMYQNRVSTLHEFIADAKAVKYKGKSAYYQSLLSQVFETQHISFINPFFKQSLIKKRIVMLSKTKSKQIHLIKYALLIPMVIGMLLYTSSYASEIKESLPLHQNDMVVQETPFPELVNHYYNAVKDLTELPEDYNEAYKNYGDIGEDYMQSRQDVAKAQALLRYKHTKLMEKQKVKGKLSADEERELEFYGQKQYSYEEYIAYKKTQNAKDAWENSADNGELRLVVEDINNLSDAEQNKRKQKIASIVNRNELKVLKITDGNTTTLLDATDAVIKKTNQNVASEDGEVPFVTLDEIPIFAGAANNGSKEANMQNTRDSISHFVARNFNTTIANEHNLTGRQRISVIFKINTLGKVVDVYARAPHPALEAEAIRVIKSLPDFKPGKYKGKTVTVPYSLPILFTLKEDEKDVKEVASERPIYPEGAEVPFAHVDEAPYFPACSDTSTEKERKNCISNEISQFVNKNFNINLANELGLKGRQRISVIFKIGKDGALTEIKAQAPHPELEKDAIRVIKELPKMTPGKHNGKAVVVPYSLPILFQVQNDVVDGNEVEELREMPSDDLLEIPYAVVDEAPYFPSCSSIRSREERKQCTSDEISQFVNKNFNVNLAEDLGLEGRQRLMVIFKICQDGIIRDIKAKGTHPDLEKEAIRVIGLLPKMKPGKQRGKAVTVPYSLPILFQVNVTTPKAKN